LQNDHFFSRRNCCYSRDRGDIVLNFKIDIERVDIKVVVIDDRSRPISSLLKKRRRHDLIPLSVDFDEALSSRSVIAMLSMPQHGTVDNVTLGSSSRCPFHFILVVALQEEGGLRTSRLCHAVTVRVQVGGQVFLSGT